MAVPAAYEALTTSEVLHWDVDVRLAWLRRVAQALDRTERALQRSHPALSDGERIAMAKEIVAAVLEQWEG